MKEYQKIFVLCILIALVYVVLQLGPTAVRRYSFSILSKHHDETYNTCGTLEHHSEIHNQSWICSNGTQILHTKRFYTLKTSEPLFTGIASLNALLECVMAEYEAGEGTRKEPYGWNINHKSVMKCMGYTHTGENKTFHEAKSQPSFLKRISERLKGKKFVKAEANPKFSKTNYFEVINSESSVFTILFAWTPFVESKWQKGLPLVEKYYPLKRIFPVCTFNEVCKDDCKYLKPDDKCEEQCRTNITTNDCNTRKLCNVNTTQCTDTDNCKAWKADQCKQLCSTNITAETWKCNVRSTDTECYKNLHVLDHPMNLLPLSKENLPGEFPEYPLYLHIIHKGTINKIGTVRVGGIDITPHQCKSSAFHVSGTIPTHKQVFVISQYWGYGYFHGNVEDMPRLTPYLDFLKNHPEIMIHGYARYLRNDLVLLGLNPDRLVFGPVKADTVFLPQGGGCGWLHPIAGQLLHHYYAMYTQQNMHQIESYDKADDNVAIAITNNASRQVNDVQDDSRMGQTESNATADVSVRTPIREQLKTNPDSIILIKRSKKRWLVQHEEVKILLEEIAAKNNMRFEVFTDKPVPSFNETVSMFMKAKLVVAPHGGGLSNLFFSRVGTRVVEILCNPRPNLCYRNLHTTLGQPYVGLLSIKKKSSAACDGPLHVDIKYLRLVVQSLLP